MNNINKIIGAILATMLLTISLQAAETKRLLVSLTSGDFKSTGSGVAIANAMQDAGVKTVIFINANSVKYALKKGNQEKFGPTNASVKDMLKSFANNGGTVAVCGMNAKYQNVTNKDLVKGAVVINGETAYGALFAPNTQTLSF